MMLENGHRRTLCSATVTGRRSRALYSVDLFARSLGVLLMCRVREPSTIVHVHLADRGSLRREGGVLRVAKRLGFATVATMHASHLDEVVVDDATCLRQVLRAADVVHALGPRSCSLLQPFLEAGQRLEMIPNGVVPPRDVTPAGGQPPLIVFAGEVGRRKGVDVLLSAFSEVRSRHPAAELVVAGPVRDVEPTPAPGVRWLGPIRPHDVGALLAGCRAAVLPSRREALPMFILEAMAHARPVVATSVGDVAEVLDAAWLVSPGDPDALAMRLTELVADPARATAVGARNRERILAHLSAAVVTRRLDDVYLELADRAPCRHRLQEAT
jgi:glycosyltransferase involved in cell wall biosynthesis